MFKATREITLGEVTILEGQEVKNPTQRMKDLGLVVEVQETKAPKVEKPKKEKKVEEVKVEEEILTEDSATVEVKAE